jgi:hypothetical protein
MAAPAQVTSLDRSETAPPGGPVRRRPSWMVAAAALIALGLSAAQAAAYYFRLELSLGPRVILQPWLLERGFVMYEQLADLHSPLMPLALAALRTLIPDGLQLAKLTLVGLLSLSTMLTCAAVSRTLRNGPAGALAGLWATAHFVSWSRAFGFGKLWHESFLAPLYALLLLLPPPTAEADDRSGRLGLRLRLAGAGLLCGLALLVKQHAAIVLAAYLLWTMLSTRSWRRALGRAGLLLTAAGAPVAACALTQWARAGTLSGTLYWTVLYTITGPYLAQAAKPPSLVEWRMLAQAGLLLPVALAVFAAAQRSSRSDRRYEHPWQPVAWGFSLLIAASATAYPRFEFFHLQSALPALAFLSALALAYAWRIWPTARTLTTGIGIGVTVLCAAFAAQPLQIALDRSRGQTIVEYSSLAPLAADITARIGPEDRIYIYPDDEASSNLYYLLQREPPRFWIFHYPWYMSAPVQAQIVAALAADEPQWIVYFADRWLRPDASPQVAAAIADHYSLADTLEWTGNRVLLLRRER